MFTAPQSKREGWLANVGEGQYYNDAVASLTCHLCGGWSLGVFGFVDPQGRELLKTGRSVNAGVEGSGSVEFLAAFPPTPTELVHDTVPKPAQEFFVEAVEDLRAGRSPAGIISKCRSVLDLCLKALSATGQTRKQRIADLKSKGILTESLAGWADKLWDDGNDAIHDLTGSLDDARQHVTFLRLLFEVAFAMPAQVVRAQAGDNQEE